MTGSGGRGPTGLPGGYVLRGLTEADLRGAQRVLDDVESAACGERRPHETRLEIEVRDSEFDMARNAWAATAPDGAVAAVGWLWPPLESGEVTTDLYVHPEHRGHGLDDALVDAMEARAGELASSSGSGAHHSLIVWSEDGDAERRSSLAERGYAKVRESVEMNVDLASEPVVPPLPPSIVLRDLRVGRDEPAVHAADVEAFSEHFLFKATSLEDWLTYHVDRPDFDPSLWLIAWDGDEVAGLVSAYAADGAALIDDLAVRRPWRGRGLGLALLLAEFRALWRRGERKVRLYVDTQNVTGAMRLYERARMHVARRFDVFARALE